MNNQTPRGPWYEKIRKALTASRETVAAPLNRLTGRGSLDDDAWDELEEILIAADMGIEAATDIVDAAKKESRRRGVSSAEEVKEIIRTKIASMAGGSESAAPVLESAGTLKVLLLIGVNGTGKTTTAGKIAARVGRSGGKAVIAASDTFRAAAIEQITEWAEKSGADVVKHKRGGDSAAVAFDAAKAAVSRGADFLIVDTAGRLHTKAPLMDELKKVKNAILKEAPAADIITLLVIDATTGQNGLSQAKAFQRDIGVDGVILTKLDGTAKGGIVLAITGQLGVPVVLAGTGEGSEDLADFDAQAFADGLVT
ncbi:MAG: signal recognition particle-docking protein FtsY [Actinomycetota bacterium]